MFHIWYIQKTLFEKLFKIRLYLKYQLVNSWLYPHHFKDGHRWLTSLLSQITWSSFAIHQWSNRSIEVLVVCHVLIGDSYCDGFVLATSIQRWPSVNDVFASQVTWSFSAVHEWSNRGPLRFLLDDMPFMAMVSVLAAENLLNLGDSCDSWDTYDENVWFPRLREFLKFVALISRNLYHCFRISPCTWQLEHKKLNYKHTLLWNIDYVIKLNISCFEGCILFK